MRSASVAASKEVQGSSVEEVETLKWRGDVIKIERRTPQQVEQQLRVMRVRGRMQLEGEGGCARQGEDERGAVELGSRGASRREGEA